MIAWPRSVVAAFVAVNLIAAINITLHDSRIGYDMADHVAYIDALAKGRLPTEADTAQFFAAPLPYVLPALLKSMGAVTRVGVIWKIAQVQNILAALLITAGMVQICRRARPDDPQLAVWALILLGSIAAYQRTLSFTRGEPLAAAMGVWAVERVLAWSNTRSMSPVVQAGLLCGLMLLAKQWGAFVVMAIVVFFALRQREWRAPIVRAFGRTGVILALTVGVAGWFYWSLDQRFGSPLAFNQPRPAFAFSNRPGFFYSLSLPSALFQAPVRDAFDEQPLPVLYADTWGDYYGYWLLTGRDAGNGGPLPGDNLLLPETVTNRAQITPYLARVNVAAVPETFLLLAGVATGIWLAAQMGLAQAADPLRRARAIAALVCVLSVAGYWGLLVWVPNLGIKASYQFQVLPFAAFGGAAVLRSVMQPSPTLGRSLAFVLAVAIVHNAGTLFSRYSLIGGFYEWH